MRLFAGLVVALLLAPSALAQRDAVSADLSPEAAAEVFKRTLLDVCVPAAAGGGVKGVGHGHAGLLGGDLSWRRSLGRGA